MFGALNMCGCQYEYMYIRQSIKKACATLIHLNRRIEVRG